MKGVIVHSTRTRGLNPVIAKLLFTYLLLPLKSGLYGFAAFFTILIAVKMVVSMSGYSEEFVVSTGDVVQSFLGFGLIFILQLAQNLHNTANRNS